METREADLTAESGMMVNRGCGQLEGGMREESVTFECKLWIRERSFSGLLHR